MLSGSIADKPTICVSQSSVLLCLYVARGLELAIEYSCLATASQAV